jgi:hypothetical protein
MKNKVFTLGLILFALFGVRMNGNAATITAVAGQGLQWSSTSTWDLGRAPIAGDAVVIPAGDSVNVDVATASYLNSITVNGALTATNSISADTVTISGNFYNYSIAYVAGNLTINSGARFTMQKDLYCSNIYNYGTFKSTKPYSQPTATLHIGYIGKTPGTGDYVIQNDGTFGDTQASGLSTSNSGSGFFIWYSNQCNSLTIQPSSSTVKGYNFTVSNLSPLPYQTNAGGSTGVLKTSANTNLNIKETISLLGYGGGSGTRYVGFSIQNSDTSAVSGTRTCTIYPGVTVYVGGKFHAYSAATANQVPTVNQGNMVYNIYGTLDCGTLQVSGYEEAFDLYMTSYAGNTGSLTINLGDGTDPATLKLNSTIKIVKQQGQNFSFNINNNSTVEFDGNTAMNYTLINGSNPAPYLFPQKYYNLTINNSSAILPFPLVVSNTKTNKSTAYGASAGKTWSSASTFYTSSYPAGSIINTGSYYYYVPYITSVSSFSNGAGTINLTGDTIQNYIVVNQTLSGTGIETGTTDTNLAWPNITLSTVTSSASLINGSILTFTGIPNSTGGWPTPTGSYTPIQNAIYTPVFDGTQPLICLGSISDFANMSTAVNLVNTDNALVYASGNQLYIKNANMGDLVAVYGVTGIIVASEVITSDNTTISLAPGIYLVRVGNKVTKVIVK